MLPADESTPNFRANFRVSLRTILSAVDSQTAVPGIHCYGLHLSTALLCLAFLDTVRAEIISELILKRAGPVVLKTFLLELIAFILDRFQQFVLQEK